MAAKDEAGPIERHVEKLVLAGAAVALVAVLLLRVYESPRKVELDGTGRLPSGRYAPEVVDEQLLQRGEALEKMLEQAKPARKPVPDYPKLLQQRFERPYDTYRISGLVQLTPGRKTAEVTTTATRQRARVKLAGLKPLPAPEAPVVNVVREVVAIPRLVPAAAAGGPAPVQPTMTYEETITAHAAAVFPHGRLLKKWSAALEKAQLSTPFVVLRVDVQRRHRQADGAWSSPVSVDSVRRGGDALPEVPKYDGTNLDAVRQGILDLARGDNQRIVLEPSSYDVFEPSGPAWVSWMQNKPRTRVSDLEPAPARPATPTPARPATPRRTMPPVAPRRTGPALPTPDMVPSYNGGRGRSTPPRYDGGRRTGPPATVAPRRPAVAPTPARPTPARPAPAGPTTDVPALRRQLEHPEGILEVWAHDVGLTVGREFQYRIRLAVLNPLFGQFQDVTQKADAELLTLMTPWSGWSPPASAARPTRFFVVGGAEQQGIVMVQAFSEKWAQPVTTSFRVLRGEPIRATVTKTVRRPDGQTEQAPVDFDTGALAVDFNFRRRHRLANTDIVLTTTELLYLDAEGALRTRTEAADRASPVYNDLKNKAQ